MKILVCGGRKFTDRSAVFDWLDEELKKAPHDTLTIIQGGATGADKLAREWCRERCVPYENYPADWNGLGNAAGPIRNQRMLDNGKPDIVMAFPGGRGTSDMTRRARAAGVPVRFIDPR